MKSIVRRKLKSNEGASLMVALLFFVVCATVGSIVLTAATAAAGRMDGLKKNNQEFYALKSAAQVFKKDWAFRPVTLSGGKDNPQISYIDRNNISLTSNNDKDYIVEFINIRDELVRKVYKEGVPCSEDYFFSANNLPTVKATVTVFAENKDYQTEIVFRTIDLEDDTLGKGTITLVFKGAKNEELVDDITVAKISWSAPQMYYGGSLT